MDNQSQRGMPLDQDLLERGGSRVLTLSSLVTRNESILQ